MEKLELRIRELLEGILNETDSYLVDLKIRPNKVEVFADCDPHITIDDCVRISRFLERQLDEEFSFSQQYALEVSSPGMDQPLKILRQYKKNIGRQIDVTMVSGMKKSGRLLFADEEKIVIEEEILKQKNNREILQSEIPFVQIKSTNIVFQF
jgi:ribosome maturation factor RimP